jgi:hypothetical protein
MIRPTVLACLSGLLLACSDQDLHPLDRGNLAPPVDTGEVLAEYTPSCDPREWDLQAITNYRPTCIEVQGPLVHDTRYNGYCTELYVGECTDLVSGVDRIAFVGYGEIYGQFSLDAWLVQSDCALALGDCSDDVFPFVRFCLTPTDYEGAADLWLFSNDEAGIDTEVLMQNIDPLSGDMRYSGNNTYVWNYE